MLNAMPQDEERKLGLIFLVEPPSWTVDIVAVHGLNGHYLNSWKHPLTGHLWLTDFLQSDFPTARVSSFGWDARLIGPSVSSVSDWGRQLADELSLRRSKPEARDKPIVIIAHSFGGIIVKEMIVGSRVSSGEENTDIFASISAILFLGTPHRGSKQLSLGSTGLKLYSLVGLKVNGQLLSELDDPSYLLRLNNDFLAILNNSNIDVYSMYETKAVLGLGIVATKDSAFLGIPNEHLRAMDSNHQQLVKFGSKQDQGYVIIHMAITKALERHARQKEILAMSKLEILETPTTIDTNAITSGRLGLREILPARVEQEVLQASSQRRGANLAPIRREPTARFVFDALADSDSAETGTGFAENWFRDLRDQVHQTAHERRKDTDQRIKVAIIDSGVDGTHPKLKKFFDRGQITARSFIEGESAMSDVCGHGTHMVDLLLRVAPNAQIFMAKVFLSGQSSEMDHNQHLIAEHVDIISMSWGYQKEIPVITGAIRDAFYHEKILFASASNTGALSKQPVAFPASLRQVMCINSTDGYGNPSEFNPSPSLDRTFAVIGEGLIVACPPKIGGESRVIRGTSAATAIAAGLAVLILQYARERANTGKAVEEPRRLSHCDAMRKVFYGMANDRSGYHVLTPATIFHEDGPNRHYRISQRISGLLDAL